jgi:adenylylsulfate kinase
MFTLWFMGLPASGKSTLASGVEHELVRRGFRVENLDGDELRKNLHPDLGFSREDRRINNRRTAYIAKLLNRNEIATIVAMITPFREAQQQAREIVEDEGKFVLIHVNCPLSVCEERDPKGLYERARAGKIDNFTGISHPYQEPIDPDVVVDTAAESPEVCVEHVVDALEERGLLDPLLEETYEIPLSESERDAVLDRLAERGHVDR